jgi:DNA invertase Pin-like site-specific DNA recombinase
VSQIRFYLDEDSVEKSLIAAFRNAGLDVVTVTDVDRLSYSDEDQLI